MTDNKYQYQLKWLMDTDPHLGILMYNSLATNTGPSTNRLIYPMQFDMGVICVIVRNSGAVSDSETWPRMRTQLHISNQTKAEERFLSEILPTAWRD